MQSLIVILIVAAAALYTGLRLWKSLRSGQATGCGCGCSCDGAPEQKKNCPIPPERIQQTDLPPPEE